MHPVSHLRHALPEDAGAWLAGFGPDLAAAWRACDQPEWLIRMCVAVDLGRGLIVHAAADLAADALAARGVSDLGPRRALAVTRRWIDGRADGSEAWAVGFATMEIAERCDGPASEAIRAAACAAFACDDRADRAFYAHQAYAARSAAHTCRALGSEADAAATVRARIPLPVFLAAFDVASRPPPPIPDAETSGPATDSFYC